MIELLKGLFDWVKQNSLTIAVWAYQRLLALVGREQQLRNRAELETKKLENSIEIEKLNAGKSDADIVRDAIEEGKRSGGQST